MSPRPQLLEQPAAEPSPPEDERAFLEAATPPPEVPHCPDPRFCAERRPVHDRAMVALRDAYDERARIHELLTQAEVPRGHAIDRVQWLIRQWCLERSRP